MDYLFSVKNHIQHKIDVIISKSLIKKSLIDECLEKLKQYQLDLTNLDNEKNKLLSVLNNIPIEKSKPIIDQIAKLESEDKIDYDVIYDTVNFDPFFKCKTLPDGNLQKIFNLNGCKFYEFDNKLIIQKDKETIYDGLGKYMGMENIYVFVKIGDYGCITRINVENKNVVKYEGFQYCTLNKDFVHLTSSTTKTSMIYHYNYNKIFNIDAGMELYKMLIGRIAIFGNNDCIKFVDIKTNKEFKSIRPRDYDYTNFQSVNKDGNYNDTLIVHLTKQCVNSQGQQSSTSGKIEIDYSDVLKCHELN